MRLVPSVIWHMCGCHCFDSISYLPHVNDVSMFVKAYLWSCLPRARPLTSLIALVDVIIQSYVFII